MIGLKHTLSIAAAGLALSVFSGQASAQIAAPSLKEMQDRMMIEDLMSRYEWALDTGDADAYAAVFLEDGVMTSGGPQETKGREAIAKMIRDLSARFRAGEKPNPDGTLARPRKVIHEHSNVVIDLKGNEATARSNWVEVWNIRTGSPEVGAAGEYHDKLVKKNGKWYFARRENRGTMSSAASTPRAPAAAPAPSAPAPAAR